MAGLRMVGMGDSMMYEYPPPGSTRRLQWYDRLTTAGWVFDFLGRVQSGQAPDPDNEGYPGARIDQLDGILEAAIDAAVSQGEGPVELMYFQGGTNDCIQGFDAAANLTAFLNHLAAYSWTTRVIVSTIPPLDPASPLLPFGVGYPSGAAVAAAVTAFNAAIPGIVTAQRALGQHVHLSMAGSGLTLSDLFSDGIHPNPPAGYTKLGQLDADAILALYAVTAPTLPGRIATRVGVAGADAYRVTVAPVGSNAVKAVRFGERVNLEGVLSLQFAEMTFDAGAIAFTVQRISPVTDASLELTITDSVGDWTTTVAMAAGPS
jgi:hypothetical protein